MRVVHVAPTAFGPRGLFGGGERYPVELARAMARLTPCELVTFGPRAGLVREPGGLRVRTLATWARLGGHPAHPLGPGLPSALAGADVVHAHHLRSAPSRIAALVGRARGVSTAVTDHGLPGGDWAGLLPRLFDRFLLVSRHSADLLGSPPGRTWIVGGGADPERFAPDPDERREGVLFVGRVTPHKGLDRLIEALPPGATLRVAGQPGFDPRPPERDYPAHVRALAEARDDVRVEFLGAVSEQRLPELYRRAELLVLPSVLTTCYGRTVAVSELLGLAAVEAMASGTPVVASRIGGLSEVVADGETGFLVEPGDVGGLRDRIATVLGDRPLAARLGRGARARALERFTWRGCAHRCLEAYAAPAGPGPPRPSGAVGSPSPSGVGPSGAP